MGCCSQGNPLNHMCSQARWGADDQADKPFPGDRAVCRGLEIRLSGARRAYSFLCASREVPAQSPRGRGSGQWGAHTSPKLPESERRRPPPATLQVFINPGLTPAVLPLLGDKGGEPRLPACQDLQVLEKEGSRRFPPRTSGVRSNWHVLRAGPAPSAFHRYFTSSTHNPTA